MRTILGSIQGYDVIYIPEKDILFCKNTAVKRKWIEDALNSNLARIKIEEKDLVITKDKNLITLGCLHLTKQQAIEILNKIKNGTNNYPEH